MSIPGWQSLILPFLNILKDGNEHTLTEIREKLSDHFQLTEAERNEPLSSGRRSKFDNRVRWVRTFLRKAGLLEIVARATYKLTERGAEILKKDPNEINVQFIEQFSEPQEFQTVAKPNGPKEEASQQTPEEVLENSYQKIRNALAEEILDVILTCSPKFFEKLVVDLLLAMGYGGFRKEAGQTVGKSGDAGIDGFIHEDKLGLDVVYIQAKRWEGTVGRPVVQSFAGSLEGFKARKGVFITTSHFSKDALEYVKMIEKKIVLINGEELAQLMIDHGVGVDEVAVYKISRIDMDYFSEE